MDRKAFLTTVCVAPVLALALPLKAKEATPWQTIKWYRPKNGRYYREITYRGSNLVHKGWVFENEVPPEVIAWSKTPPSSHIEGM